MLSKNFSLFFFLRKTRNKEPGKQPVYIRLTINGARVEWSVQRQCAPERWNSRAGRATGTRQEIKILNAYLDLLQAKIHEAYRSLIDQDKVVTDDRIKGLLVGSSKEKDRMILEVFQHHNDQVEQLVGTEFAAGTLERYKISLEHTRNFMKWYDVPDLEIRKLNHEFISEYAFWLKSIRKCSHNTTMKYLANFKKIVLICLKNGWLQKDPFTGFKLVKREIERPFLTGKELQTITSKQFVPERLPYVRNIFLFSCYTGLAYADVKKLKRSEVGVGVDGEQWIFTRRKKTDTSTRIPLLPA